MAYKVLLSTPAERDIGEAVKFIAANSPEAASRWLGGLQQAILSLEDIPARHALVPEAASLGMPYRSLPYFSHRVVYRVDEASGQVFVVRVYHGAKKPMEEEDTQAPWMPVLHSCSPLLTNRFSSAPRR